MHIVHLKKFFQTTARLAKFRIFRSRVNCWKLSIVIKLCQRRRQIDGVLS